MPNYTFTTPTFREGPAGDRRLFYYYKLDKGYTVVKSNGVYSLTRFLVDGDIANYQEVYLGGRNHTVNSATKTALIAANIGITEANFKVQ